MGICEHWSIDPLGPHFKPSRLHCERPRPSPVYFEPLKLLNSDFNADPDPDFHSNADPDPDPASRNYANPDPQPCLLVVPVTFT